MSIDKAVALAQLTRAREFVITAGPEGRFRFKARRPTQAALTVEAASNAGNVVIGIDRIRDGVIGWEGVLESDILPGGASDPMPFDVDVYRAWIVDRPDLWDAMSKQISAKIAEHSKQFEEAPGNS